MSGTQCGSFVVVDNSWRERKTRKRKGNRRTTPTTEKTALTAHTTTIPTATRPGRKKTKRQEGRNV
jgi:hypothetical protein